MGNARVFRLVPATSSTVSFEDAFGEYSEARGKGRERRKKRKLERIENRKEVKQARTAARDEVKSERQEDRIGRRERRKAGRQAIRTEQSEARQERRGGRQEKRQTRRTDRTVSRLGRKGLRKDFRSENEDLEQGLDVATPQEMGGVSDMPEQPIRETPDTYSDESQESYDQPAGYDQEGPQNGGSGSYDDQGDYSDETSYGDEQYDEQYDEEPTGEGEYDEEGNYVGEDSGYLAEYDASGDNFDGDGIDPNVQKVADKLVWNVECIKRLEQKRRSMPNQAQGFSKQIIDRKRLHNELKSSLDDYANCYGDYSNAEGESQGRKLMIGKAMRNSKLKLNRGKHKGHAYGRPSNVIPVASDLHPNFKKNRIVVPGHSNAEGTGLNGLDLQDDFDAPRVREVFLGADGSKSKISWGSIVVGVAVGVAAVWAIKKYKLLK